MIRDKSRRRRSWIVAAVVLVCGGLIAGCGSSTSGTSSESNTSAASSSSAASSASSESASNSAESSGTINVPKESIGYVEPAAVDEVTNRDVQQMEASAKALGWELKYTNAQGNIPKAVAALEGDINAGVNAIVVGSTNASLFRQPLLRAKEKGIPAIVIGGGVEQSSLYAAEYTENEPLTSKLLTEEMVKGLGGKGEVGAIEITELSSGVERAQAREEVLKGTGVKVAVKQDGSLENPIQGTKQITSAMLTAHPNLSALWLVYDYMMPPAIEAMEQLGNKHTKIYTWFAGPENVKLLREKPNVEALIEDNLDHTALIAMDQLAAHFKNGTPINPHAIEECPLHYVVVTKTNGKAPAPGKLIWPVQQDREPFIAKWKEGKFGEGADCGTKS